MIYPRYGAFSASFVRECTDVSYVAGEGVELTVLKESVDVEEIKNKGSGTHEISSCAVYLRHEL